MIPDPSSDASLAGLAARLFFDRQLSKVEIAQRLGVSRFKVARLIDQARTAGLVRIEYRDDIPQDTDLGRAVEERFGLDLCAVAATTPGRGGSGQASEGDIAPAASLAAASLAASLLDGIVSPGDVVGIAWGSTLAAVARSVAARPDAGVTVVQLAGSSRHIDRLHEPGEVSRILADRWSARHLALFAPAFVESAELRGALVRQPELAVTVDAFARLTLAIVGIGAIGSADAGARSSLLESGALSEEDIAGLRSRGAVGDLVVHPFDPEGRFVAPDLGTRAIAIGVEELRRTRVLAVAGGAAKAAAIGGALRTGIVKMLVTDAAAARALTAAPRSDAVTAARRRSRSPGR